MGKRRAERQQESAVQEAPPESPPAPGGEGGGMDAQAMQRLKELADLHEQGVLTDEEFAAQKTRILG